MNEIAGFARQILKAIKEFKDKETKSIDTQAQVKRVEGDTLWVHIPGGVDETPVKKTVNAKEGDQVQVRISGGRAWVTGNSTAPPTDDKKAVAAQLVAEGATDMAKAAGDAANEAAEDAKRAHDAADAAQGSADVAGQAADSAMVNLAEIENVVGTLNWITAHGTMTLTTDVAIDPSHVYFVRDPNGNYHVGEYYYSIVTEPKAEELSTYYVLTVDESIQNYVATHVAVDAEGLWLLPESSGAYKILIATGAGTVYTSPGTFIIDSSGNVVATFGTSVILGKDNNNLIISSEGLKGIDEQGKEYLDMDVNGSYSWQYYVFDSYSFIAQSSSQTVTRQFSFSEHETDESSYRISVSSTITGVRPGSTTAYYPAFAMDISLGVAQTESFGTNQTIAYDGGNTVTVTVPGVPITHGANKGWYIEASAERYNTTPSFKIGLGLKALSGAYFVAGQYNENRGNNGSDLIFAIGNGAGNAYGDRSNAIDVDTDGNQRLAGTLSQGSDRRLKEHVDFIDDDAVKFIRKLKPAHYIKDGLDHVGFYAQDVDEADPWNCMTGEMNGYMTLCYTEIIAPLVKYCQQLEKRIESLENLI